MNKKRHIPFLYYVITPIVAITPLGLNAYSIYTQASTVSVRGFLNFIYVYSHEFEMIGYGLFGIFLVGVFGKIVHALPSVVSKIAVIFFSSLFFTAAVFFYNNLLHYLDWNYIANALDSPWSYPIRIFSLQI